LFLHILYCVFCFPSPQKSNKNTKNTGTLSLTAFHICSHTRRPHGRGASSEEQRAPGSRLQAITAGQVLEPGSEVSWVIIMAAGQIDQ